MVEEEEEEKEEDIEEDVAAFFLASGVCGFLVSLCFLEGGCTPDIGELERELERELECELELEMGSLFLAGTGDLDLERETDLDLDLEREFDEEEDEEDEVFVDFLLVVLFFLVTMAKLLVPRPPYINWAFLSTGRLRICRSTCTRETVFITRGRLRLRVVVDDDVDDFDDEDVVVFDGSSKEVVGR